MNRREEIINAVIDIYKAKGMTSDFTMSELASKLDIGKSTIYEYFKTKDEILSHALGHILDEVTKTILEHKLPETYSFEESIKSEMRYIFEIAKESKLLMNVISPNFQHAIPQSCDFEVVGRMHEVAKFYQARFIAIFEKGIAEGIFTRKLNVYDEIFISSIIAGSVMRVTNQYIHRSEEVDLDTYINYLYQSLLSVVNKETPKF